MAAFFIGIFTKELVGLEMVMLCQFTYLSLFYFEGILQLPYYSLSALELSTGFNTKSGTWYTLTANNPPQSRVLDFDPLTFSNNFNFGVLLYIVPLIAILPFIPLKAKCIRKLSMIELGHKWVDLLLGEIYLSFVLFNFQFLMFSIVNYYADERGALDYLSLMFIPLSLTVTVLSFLGLIFKPEIYGNFRTSFRFDIESIAENV